VINAKVFTPSARSVLRFIIGFSGVLSLVSCATLPTSSQSSAIQRVDEYLLDGVSNGFSGTVLIAVDGEIVLQKGYGLADRETQSLNTPETLFTIGSVTKQFTAAAIMKLVEMDKVSLDATLADYFVGLPDDKMGITVHQLLTHSSGLVGDVTDGDFSEPISFEEYFDRVVSTQLRFNPGEQYAYSNAGYTILAKIIELASDQDYERFLREQLFEPAGMSSTGYSLPEEDLQSFATGYRFSVIESGTVVERIREAGEVPPTLKGNGGLSSNLADMYRWYRALSQASVLSQNSIERLTTPYIAEQASGESHYGYGWAIYNSDRDTKIINHNGGNGVFFHDFLWLPEEDAVIIFFSNTASPQIEVTWRLEKILFDPNYTPRAIQKSFLQYVFDFTRSNDAEMSSQLSAELRTQYTRELERSFLLNRLGYMHLRGGGPTDVKPEWAIKLFQLNVELFPENGNLWDSLGDGYLAVGDREKARASFQQALALGHTESTEKLDALLEDS